MHDIRNILAKYGALLEGEFFIALKNKERVATKYVNFDPILTYPALVKNLTSALVVPWEKKVQVLAVPAVGAIGLLIGGVAGTLSVRVVWADKQKDGTFAFERMGFAEAVRGKRVVALEDICSTGGSLKAVCDLVRLAGGELIAAACVWNRGDVTDEMLGIPELRSLIKETIPSWAAGEHPNWGSWPLVEDVGHPEHFPDYPGPRIKLMK